MASVNSIDITSGDFTIGSWEIKDGTIQQGFYNIEQIPIKEFTALTKDEEIGKDIYLTAKVGSKQFKAKTDTKSYKELYEIYSSDGGEPTGKEMPLVYKDKNAFLYAAVLGFVLLFILVSLNDGASSSSSSLTNSNKISMCKSYIGKMFGRSPSIMRGQSVSDNGFLVSYTRSSDNSNWSYVCNIEDGRMVWASWNPNNQELGRWRFEDEVSYKISSDKVRFTVEGKSINLNL